MSRLSVHSASKNPRACRGLVEHDGAGDLDLAHGDVPPVAAGPVGVRQGQRQPGPPPLAEPLDGVRTEGVAELLQPGRVVGGGEPVVQLGEPDPRRRRGAFGVLVAVEPDLDRVREVRAHFDERWPEHLIDQVEVVRGDPPVGLGVAEPRQPNTVGVGVVGGAGEHPLELLRLADRGHPTPAPADQPVQVRAHHLQLAFPLREAQHRDVVLSGELGDVAAKPQPDLLQQRRGRDREPQMRGQEADHLAGQLQRRHPPVQVDPIEALQVQTHVPIQDVVHGDHTGRHRMPPGSGAAQPRQPALTRPQRHPPSRAPPRRSEAKPL